MKSRVLLVDLGNTRIKWAWLDGGGRLGRMSAAVHFGWRPADFVVALRGLKTGDRVLAVSVAAPALRRRFASAVRATCGVSPQFLKSARAVAGVRNGYREPWRLGADRWAAMIGGCTTGKAVLVVDVGTAATLDLIDAEGVHRGGAIVPGHELMVGSLLAGTGGIRKRAAAGARFGAVRGKSVFARSTREAVEAGARHALLASIEHAVIEATRELGRRPQVLLTGGGAASLRKGLRIRHAWRPALVLEGLAKANSLLIEEDKNR